MLSKLWRIPQATTIFSMSIGRYYILLGSSTRLPYCFLVAKTCYYVTWEEVGLRGFYASLFSIVRAILTSSQSKHVSLSTFNLLSSRHHHSHCFNFGFKLMTVKIKGLCHTKGRVPKTKMEILNGICH